MTESDLQNLIDNKVMEGKTLEYKQDLMLTKDSEKKEFLADISSLANAAGGDLIVGIACDKATGEPQKLDGLNLQNSDSEILKIESLIRTGINPRINGLETRSIKLASGNSMIFIRIPQSWNSPHMVTYQGSNKFYTRSSNGKHLMDVEELRNSFTLSEKLNERISNFRIDRVGKIYSNDAFIPLPEDIGKIVFQMVPFSAFSNSHQFPFNCINELKRDIKPMRAGGWDHQFNLDGFMGFAPNSGYVQIFKNGIIEGVDASLLGLFLSSTDYSIPSQALEELILESYNNFFDIFKKLSVDGPFVIFLSLVGVKKYSFATNNYFRRMIAVNRINNGKDVINLPENIVQDVNVPSAGALKPVFDSLWNAYGFEKSENYDDSGNRKQ